MLEKAIAELKKIVPFKETAEIGDILLVLAEEEQQPTLIYALLTAIERDESRKDEWWHVSMQLLTVPPQPVTWTLRTPQLTGQESFTMGGKGRFIKAIQIDQQPTAPSPPESKRKSGLRLVK